MPRLPHARTSAAVQGLLQLTRSRRDLCLQEVDLLVRRRLRLRARDAQRDEAEDLWRADAPSREARRSHVSAHAGAWQRRLVALGRDSYRPTAPHERGRVRSMAGYCDVKGSRLG